jgi:hypothetical protein
MNNEQQELLDEAYKNYCTQLIKDSFLLLRNRLPLDIFINKCKTDPEFSERWGLKIEERELSLEERYDLIEKDKYTQFVKWQDYGTDRIKEVLDEKNVPTKLITITYNDKTITSYE